MGIVGPETFWLPAPICNDYNLPDPATVCPLGRMDPNPNAVPYKYPKNGVPEAAISEAAGTPV